MNDINPPGTRTLQKKQTRKQILDAAGSLFSLQGFEKTTTREIAEAAGVAAGTLFSHFEDKHQLLVATLHHSIEQVLQKAFTSLNKSDKAIDQFLHIVGSLYEFYLRNRSLSRALLQQGLFHTGNQKSSLDEQIGQFTDFVSNLVLQGQKKGEIASNLSPDLVAENFMASYFYCLIGGVRDENLSSDMLLTKLRQLLMQQLHD